MILKTKILIKRIFLKKNINFSDNISKNKYIFINIFLFIFVYVIFLIGYLNKFIIFYLVNFYVYTFLIKQVKYLDIVSLQFFLYSKVWIWSSVSKY